MASKNFTLRNTDICMNKEFLLWNFTLHTLPHESQLSTKLFEQSSILFEPYYFKNLS